LFLQSEVRLLRPHLTHLGRLKKEISAWLSIVRRETTTTKIIIYNSILYNKY